MYICKNNHMPTFPKEKKHFWIVKNDKPSQGRLIINTFYSSKEWRKIRNSFIKGISTHLPYLTSHSNGCCYICRLINQVTNTTTIDHIQPINREDAHNVMAGKYGNPLDFENLCPLCTVHHNKKSAIERNYGQLPLINILKIMRIVDKENNLIVKL